MNDQSTMFDLTTCGDTGNAISSLASGSGVTPCVSPDGKMTAKSGPAPAPVSPSARPAKAKRSTTKGIFGQSSFDSSKHDDLSFALASRYRALTDSLGSTLFEVTWMTRLTPAGFSIPAQRASERRTDDSVCIGWPTRTTEDHKSDGPRSKARVDTGQALQSDLRLRNLVLLAGWPTARAADAEKNVRTVEGAAREMERKGCPQDLSQAVSLASWGTPAARDWKSGDASQDTLDRNARPLNEQVRLTSWKTPCVPNGGQGPHLDGKTKDQIGLENEARLTAFGETPIGYLPGPNGWEIVPASGQLNAAHSRWLMGLPPVWDACGVTAMASLRNRRRRS